MAAVHSALYEGRLAHARKGPRPHRFSYRLHMFYLDLDETAVVFRRSVLLREGRLGLLSFFRDDYLGDPARPLKEAVLDLVESRLGSRPQGPVRLLAMVRCLGYVFNPVSFYYCFGADGTTLEAVVAEITNTPWRERHAYVLPAGHGAVRAVFDKAFHVSPFFAMAQRYLWLITTPGESLSVTMVNEEHGKEVFSAALTLDRHALTPSALQSVVLRQPFMAARVHLGIYVQAFRLWLKRTPYYTRPATRAAADSRRKA